MPARYKGRDRASDDDREMIVLSRSKNAASISSHPIEGPRHHTSADLRVHLMFRRYSWLPPPLPADPPELRAERLDPRELRLGERRLTIQHRRRDGASGALVGGGTGPLGLERVQQIADRRLAFVHDRSRVGRREQVDEAEGQPTVGLVGLERCRPLREAALQTFPACPSDAIHATIGTLGTFL